MAPDYSLGFETLETEVEDVELEVEGSLPGWLEGTLVRNGPAKFEAGDTRMNHWFDGYAMLHAFEMDDGEVLYSNRYLETDAYNHAEDEGEMGYSEFATDPCRNLFEKVFSFFSPDITDNANVNVGRFADRFVAMTETPLPVEFDPETLETVGVFDYDDSVDGHLTTAHPHHDPERGVTVNYVTEFSRTSTYKLYTFDDTDADADRDVVGKYDVDKPAYMHSFALTPNYAVLAEFPLVLSLRDLLLRSRPFIENYDWEPDRGTRFLVFDRSTGDVVTEPRADAFFAFHHVNAFETRDGDEVVLDVAAYPDPDVVDSFYLDTVLSDASEVPGGELRRYRLPLDGGDVEHETVYSGGFELPRIRYGERNGREYRYAYGVGNRDEGDFPNRLVKVDVKEHEASVWDEGGYPGEPVFVPSPEGEDEDDGVVLSVVLDPEAETSYLLVLDAVTFDEVARAETPNAVPFGFHGQFFGSV